MSGEKTAKQIAWDEQKANDPRRKRLADKRAKREADAVVERFVAALAAQRRTR